MFHPVIKVVLFSFLMLALLPPILCAQTTAVVMPAADLQEEELIHYGDVIDVDFVGGFDLDWRGSLTPEGFLDGLDGYGDPIYGLCRSEASLAAEITKVFGKVLRDPKVIVRIIDRSNRASVRLEGGVKVPTRFRVLRPVRLSELIVLAGGLTDSISGEISIFRPANLSCLSDRDRKGGRDNGSQTINIRINELLSGAAGSDPPIVSGDMVMVKQSDPVYVIGAVSNPRPVYLRAGLTVSRAIASAGGLARDGGGKKAIITRRAGGETKQIEVDLGEIKADPAKDEVLRAFDIVDVIGKRSNKRRYPPSVATEAASQKYSTLPLRVVD